MVFDSWNIGFAFLSSFEYSKQFTFPLIGCTFFHYKNANH